MLSDIVSTITGAARAVLSFLGLAQRRHQERPRLDLEADLVADNPVTLGLTVWNSGPRDARIVRLYLTVRCDKCVVGEMDLPGLPFIDKSALPQSVASGEPAYFYVGLEFLELRLMALGCEGRCHVTPTVTDDLGNRYKTEPFKLRVS